MFSKPAICCEPEFLVREFWVLGCHYSTDWFGAVLRVGVGV